jgi:hypothetical protein
MKCRDFEVDENRMIRFRKLQALRKEELSTQTLRALFRLLDEDGSGEVSAQEIRHGLILLGFEEATDPIALSRVVSDIDDDNTGTITESEFLSFFSKQNRTSLSWLLKSYVLEHTYIIATTYGTCSKCRHTQHRLGLQQKAINFSAIHLRNWPSSCFSPPSSGSCADFMSTLTITTRGPDRTFLFFSITVFCV